MKGSLPFLTVALRAGYIARCSPSSKEARWPKTDRATHSVCEPHKFRSNPSVLSYSREARWPIRANARIHGGAPVGRSLIRWCEVSDPETKLYPDETHRDLFFVICILNSGEADMLSDQLWLTLSRSWTKRVWQRNAESRHGGSWACCHGEFVQPC